MNTFTDGTIFEWVTELFNFQYQSVCFSFCFFTISTHTHVWQSMNHLLTLLSRIFSTICRAYKKQSVYLLKMPNYQRQIGFFENVFVICVMLSLVNKMFPKYNFLYCQYLSLELPCIIQNKAKIYFLRQRVLISKIGIFFTFSEAHHLLCRDL